jgi:hypothetical protein
MQSHDCCENCGKVAASMPQCQRCFTSRFCLRSCQTAGWVSHKERCKEVKQAQGTERMFQSKFGNDSRACFLFDSLQVRI